MGRNILKRVDGIVVDQAEEAIASNNRQNSIRATIVTPNDSTDLTNPGNLYIGGGGDIAVIPYGQDTSVILYGVVAGQELSLVVKRVLSTNTTATNILVMY
ncbi:MAG: spike base protein, RCAP_Rcc01079 family [Candidatus Hodarchaeales archaeon]